MKQIFLFFLYGFLTWLIPFITAFLFFDRQGQLTISQPLFKSIMVVVGVLVGVICLVLYFQKITKDYLRQGIINGLSWLAINLILDVLILVPMGKYTLSGYFFDIGLRYLSLAIISIGMGYLLQKKIASL